MTTRILLLTTDEQVYVCKTCHSIKPHPAQWPDSASPLCCDLLMQREPVHEQIELDAPPHSTMPNAEDEIDS